MIITFNSLCEIHAISASRILSALLTFNSLCEIPGTEYTWNVSRPLYFQFSLWDSHWYRYRGVYWWRLSILFVRFLPSGSASCSSTAPFNSLCEIRGTKPFSLLEATTSFNSLCEIHRDANTHGPLPYRFQFSLWDSARVLVRVGVTGQYLSILFVRFIMMYYDFTVNMTDFQFSLWDSAGEGLGLEYFRQFLSILFVRFHGWVVHLYGQGALSILFVRFRFCQVKRGRSPRYLSILFVRFNIPPNHSSL